MICPIRQVVLKFDLSGCKIIWAWTTSEQVLMLSLVNDSCGINICKPCLCSVLWFCWFRWTITRCLESLSCVMNHEYVQYFDFAELIEINADLVLENFVLLYKPWVPVRSDQYFDFPDWDECGLILGEIGMLYEPTVCSVLWFSWFKWMPTRSWRVWISLWTKSLF